MIGINLIALAAFTLAATVVAQQNGSPDPQERFALFNRQLAQDGIHAQIGQVVAEKLLLHKEEPVVKKPPMGARVMGTVVVAFEIDSKGTVRHPIVISGPKMLQQAAIEAVKKYRYKPYILNKEPISVGTMASIYFDLQ